MVTSISIDRTALLLGPLVIDNNPFGTDFHLPEDGMGRPNFTLRKEFAPASQVVGGSQILTIVPDVGSLPLRIYAHGTTTAELYANMAVLEAALGGQWAGYELTQTIDGVAKTYLADPELPAWGPVDSGEVAAFIAICTITVPLQPGLVT